ncbi:MAG TPA: cell division protein ZapB [Candidatus Binataceae bacterium]|nr:cell division protein ZapB [Candidatus Binataceae bacterium]
MSFEILKQLDERVKAVIERTEQLRHENARLNEQLEEGRRRLEEVSAQLRNVQEQCHQHEAERVEVKTRIEKLLARFDGLDLA